MSWWPRNRLKRNFAFSHKDRSDDNLASVGETIRAISRVASRASQLVTLHITDKAAKTSQGCKSVSPPISREDEAIV